jgi:hypothetical protein
MITLTPTGTGADVRVARNEALRQEAAARDRGAVRVLPWFMAPGKGRIAPLGFLTESRSEVPDLARSFGGGLRCATTEQR